MELTWTFVRRVGLVLAVLSAAAGVVWYAMTPGVGSYQASSLLTLPLVMVVLVWLHHRLPVWLQWAIAIPLALVGPIGYLVAGGAQWWNWGQVASFPLVMLAIALSLRSENDEASEPWYGGVGDGPWGPP
jgi:hypothetical protein